MEKSRLALAVLFVFTVGCQQDVSTAPTKTVPPPATMRVAGDWNCLYDVFTDDLVCWGGAGDWGDQFGVPYGSSEVPGNDPAYYDNTYGWSDTEGYYSGSYGYPWDGNSPDTFDPQWWGYRDNTWYHEFGDTPTNDQYVVTPPDTAPLTRLLKPWEDTLFKAEAKTLKNTVDPHNFCKPLGSLLDTLLNNYGQVTAYDNHVYGTYQGHRGEKLGMESGIGASADIAIHSDANAKSRMLQSLRHEGGHALGLAAGDGIDIVGQTQDPNGSNYLDPQGPHFKSVVMKSDPWQMNAENAGYYCAFWETGP